jgi:hypothetical protein
MRQRKPREIITEMSPLTFKPAVGKVGGTGKSTPCM